MDKKPDHPLRVWRTRENKKLTEVAKAVGVVPSHLSQIENGSRSPSLALAAKLSRETDIPVEAFAKAEAAS